MTPYRTLSRASLAAALAFSFAFAGCSSNEQSVKDAANLFFESFNHLCEADTLKVSGTLDLIGTQSQISAQMISSPAQLALSLGQPNAEPLIDFYLRDGRTYLNAMGTKTASVAENIGISKDQKLHLPNPFLELSREERAKLFDSVKVKDDVYTFVINNREAEKFLDYYGAAKVNKATLVTTIHDDVINTLSIDIDGTYEIDTASSDLDLKADLVIEQVGGKMTIDFPADLDTYKTE